MLLAFSGRSQSKTVVDKFQGQTKTTTKSVAAVTDPLTEQKVSMDQSGGEDSSGVDFNSGGAETAGGGGSRSSASRSSSGSGGGGVANNAVANAASGGSYPGNARPQAGAGSGSEAGAANAAGAASGGSDTAVTRKRFSSGGGPGPAAAGPERAENPGAKPKGKLPIFWIVVIICMVVGVFFGMIFAGRHT